MLLFYILIFPAISAVILWIIVRAFYQEIKKAKADDKPIV